jgi:hypothetical protein
MFDIEQHGIRAGSRVLIQGESGLSGRTGVVAGEENRDTGEWPVRIDGEGQDSIAWLHSRSLHEIVLNAREPLLASNGLYIQPYCASVSIPPSVLSRFVF